MASIDGRLNTEIALFTRPAAENAIDIWSYKARSRKEG